MSEGTLRILDARGLENDTLKSRNAQLTADLEAARRRVGELEAVAADAARWLQSPKDGDATGVFEDIGDWFHEETGLLRPGKSYPMQGPPPEGLENQWREWCEAKRKSIRANLCALLEKGEGR